MKLSCYLCQLFAVGVLGLVVTGVTGCFKPSLPFKVGDCIQYTLTGTERWESVNERIYIIREVGKNHYLLAFWLEGAWYAHKNNLFDTSWYVDGGGNDGYVKVTCPDKPNLTPTPKPGVKR